MTMWILCDENYIKGGLAYIHPLAHSFQNYHARHVEAHGQLPRFALFVHLLGLEYAFLSLCLLVELSDAWIITLSVLSLVIVYPYGNMKAIDAFFFGASSSTESGLNTFVTTPQVKTPNSNHESDRLA
jgi:hypothetical protein